ncbi:hypothetical protein [Streptomyces sp. NPDC093589]|uniref:hypothetical protein n=1 Tax=Streptomyces sp. NPDC093589 TaxID=3366043 RepID=UPI0037F224F5
MSPELQPGDWHETLVDLLAMGCGIPEDRAGRLLDRHAEEARAETPTITVNAPRVEIAHPGPVDEPAILSRVRALAAEWEFMSGRRNARDELLAALKTPKRQG